jgi:hypothetical protein
MASRVFPPDSESLLRVQRESADSYERVCAGLNDNWRIAVSKGGTEWLLQCRSENKSGVTRWRTPYRCSDRPDLLARVRELCGPVDDAANVIASLPDLGKGSR